MDQIETLEAEIESATSEAARAMAMAAMAMAVMGGFDQNATGRNPVDFFGNCMPYFFGGAVLRMCKVMVGINSCSFFKPNMTWVLMKIRELLWNYSIRVEVCGQKEDCNII